MVNINEIVNTKINNILNDNNSIEQKKKDLFELHQKILGTEKQYIGHLLQSVFEAVRIVDSERYQRIKEEEDRRCKEQRKIEEEMRNFDLFSIAFPKEEFPEMHCYKQPEPEAIDIDIEDLTEQMSNLTVDLKKYKVTELKKIAKINGLKKYSKLKKEPLIELLQGINNLKLF